MGIADVFWGATLTAHDATTPDGTARRKKWLK
jgi:hypothetical protein